MTVALLSGPSTLLYLAFKEIPREEKGFSLVWELPCASLFHWREALKVIISFSGSGNGRHQNREARCAFWGAIISTILVVVVLRELGPLLTAFIVIGRSETAVLGWKPSRISINPVYFIVTPDHRCQHRGCLPTLYFNAVAFVGFSSPGSSCLRIYLYSERINRVLTITVQFSN
jgi:hypothetical protein